MPKTKNKYSYPVELTPNVRIALDESPAHIGKLKHAVDFIVIEGTPIKAAASGIVVDVKQDSNISGPTKNFDKFGNYIEIKHNSNEYSIYEHIKNSGSLVKKGDKVKQGQIIGYSGNTGWIAHLGPHVHFDVHKYLGKGKENYATIQIVWKRKK